MRRNLLHLLLATMTVLVLGAGTAHAAPIARYIGSGGPVGSLGCAATTIGGAVDAGLLGDIDEITYQNCQLIVAVEVDPLLPWTMNAVSPSAYTIDNIEIDFSGPGCAGTVGGSANASYDSVSGVLTVVDQATVVTFVDPANNCLGLITEGSPLPVLSGSYDIVIVV